MNTCLYCGSAEAHWVYKPLCLHCHHWIDIVLRQNQLVITNGHAYSIGTANDYPKGFGGTPWRITFTDGRVVDTNSLWHLGEIPPRFAPLLVENATLEQRQSVEFVLEVIDDLPPIFGRRSWRRPEV